MQFTFEGWELIALPEGSARWLRDNLAVSPEEVPYSVFLTLLEQRRTYEASPEGVAEQARETYKKNHQSHSSVLDGDDRSEWSGDVTRQWSPGKFRR